MVPSELNKVSLGLSTNFHCTSGAPYWLQGFSNRNIIEQVNYLIKNVTGFRLGSKFTVCIPASKQNISQIYA